MRQIDGPMGHMFCKEKVCGSMKIAGFSYHRFHIKQVDVDGFTQRHLSCVFLANCNQDRKSVFLSKTRASHKGYILTRNSLARKSPPQSCYILSERYKDVLHSITTPITIHNPYIDWYYPAIFFIKVCLKWGIPPKWP